MELWLSRSMTGSKATWWLPSVLYLFWKKAAAMHAVKAYRQPADICKITIPSFHSFNSCHAVTSVFPRVRNVLQLPCPAMLWPALP